MEVLVEVLAEFFGGLLELLIEPAFDKNKPMKKRLPLIIVAVVIYLIIIIGIGALGFLSMSKGDDLTGIIFIVIALIIAIIFIVKVIKKKR